MYDLARKSGSSKGRAVQETTPVAEMRRSGRVDC